LTDLLLIISQVLEALNQLNVPYMIVGALSSNLYGEPRQTDDADFVIELGNIPLSTLISKLGPGFKLDTQLGFETITGSNRYHIYHIDSEFLIEFFLLTPDAHNQSRFARRKSIVFADVPAFVQSVEDVIVQKLRWYKRGHRQKDLDDAKNVVDTQAGIPDALDLAYIRHWTDQIFEKLLADADGGST
jgi:hypothetical protein